MTDKIRIKIAAAITALFIAGISAAGLAAQSDKPQTAAADSAPGPTAQQTSSAAQTPSDAPAVDASTLSDDVDDEHGHGEDRYEERGDDD